MESLFSQPSDDVQSQFRPVKHFAIQSHKMFHSCLMICPLVTQLFSPDVNVQRLKASESGCVQLCVDGQTLVNLYWSINTFGMCVHFLIPFEFTDKNNCINLYFSLVIWICTYFSCIFIKTYFIFLAPLAVVFKTQTCLLKIIHSY